MCHPAGVVKKVLVPVAFGFDFVREQTVVVVVFKFVIDYMLTKKKILNLLTGNTGIKHAV